MGTQSRFLPMGKLAAEKLTLWQESRISLASKFSNLMKGMVLFQEQ